MIRFEATLFDGRSSRANPAVVDADANFLRIVSGSTEQCFALNECRIEPPLGTTSRIFYLPDGARLETVDIKAVARLEKLAGHNPAMRLINWLETNWTFVLTCFAGLLLCIGLLTAYGIPLAAEKIAFSLSADLLDDISRHSLKILDTKILQPSEIEQSRIQELNKIFKDVTSELGSGFDYRLEIRKGGGLGANAFALPSGTILMTDELVALAENDFQVMAVMAHEIGHVENRHGLRSIIQNTGVFMVIAILAGDVVSVTSTAAALPTLLIESGYSRRFEREADRVSGLYLISKNLGTAPMRDILQLLENESPDSPGTSLISTHPETEERIRLLLELETRIDGKHPDDAQKIFHGMED